MAINQRAIDKIIAKYQSEITPAEIRRQVRLSRESVYPQTADDVRVGAAVVLREELAKHCW